MKQILVVEDNELNMKLFGDMLLSQNYEVSRAINGEIALKMVEDGLRPDLFVMDIQLPNMSGLELIKILRTRTEFVDTPIIAITAFAMKGDCEEFKSKGCTDYMSKPINILDFVQMVKGYLL